ncbi:hypothetical protein [Ensifer adhaerens]|uniref:hypothetical protein n=1 Tax=Ensifer adhaerens TaxID=106592 RepID=UPI0015C31F44|nr:hypothetical protein [Ensifer adhaerens]
MLKPTIEELRAKYTPEQFAELERQAANRKMVKPPPNRAAPVNAGYVHDVAELAGRAWANDAATILTDATAQVLHQIREEVLARIEKLEAENAELRKLVYGETFHGA